MTVSVVVPAYNEAQVLPRLLDALADAHAPLDVVVVCNGCTDDTEAVARSHAIRPRVLRLAQGSKHAALVAGDEAATSFPRFYVDADVVIGGADLEHLASELTRRRLLAIAPTRELDLDRSSPLVRGYYWTWSQLPAARTGLFGRGVIGVTEDGFARLGDRPEVLGDDLWTSSQFAPHEQAVSAAARSRVVAPLHVGDLVRRRIRTAQGNGQLRGQLPHPPATSTVRTAAALAWRHPGHAPHVAAFAAITAASRLLARARRSDSWLRDTSSRQGTSASWPD